MTLATLDAVKLDLIDYAFAYVMFAVGTSGAVLFLVLAWKVATS